MSKFFLFRGINLFFCLVVLAGCGTRVGPRTAGGTYLDASGEAVNAYADSLSVTVEASLQVLASVGAPILYRRTDSGRAIISATSPNGSPLRLRFTEEGRALTKVTIRTGTTGYWQQEFSYHLHVLIQERLTRGGRPEPAALAASDPPAAVSAPPVEDAASADTFPEASPPAPQVAGTAGGTAGFDSPRTEAAVVEEVPAPSLPQAAVSPGPPPGEPEARVYFETDSNLPKAGEMDKLDRLISQLLAHPSWRLSVTGQAEALENDGDHRLLSENRAIAVKFYFVGKGIAPDRITVGWGEGMDGAEAGGPADRRRADLRLVRGPDPTDR